MSARETPQAADPIFGEFDCLALERWLTALGVDVFNARFNSFAKLVGGAGHG